MMKWEVMGGSEVKVVGGVGETALTSNFAQSSLSCSSFPFGKIALTSAFEAFMGMLDAFITAQVTDTHTHTHTHTQCTIHNPPSVLQKQQQQQKTQTQTQKPLGGSFLPFSSTTAILTTVVL